MNDEHVFSKKVINYGDTVIIYDNNSMKCIFLQEGQVYNCKYGSIKHDEIVNHNYGTKIMIGNKGGYIHTLPLSPELWTKTLTHRTQIIYSTDASLIVRNLELSPGKKVFEAGIGSGSLSHYIARAIWPSGSLTSFDFHELRAEQAKNEFESHGLGDIVKAGCRDIIGEGFPMKTNENGVNELAVDAIILDLPNPWRLISKLPSFLKQNEVSRICIFAPCIEQVQKSSIALSENGFVSIRTIECLSRKYSIKKKSLMTPNIGQKYISLSEEDLCEVLQPITSDVSSYPYVNEQKCNYKYECFPESTMPGHTGFLTFAILLPRKL